MITLLASIAGFVSSLIPEIVKFFKDKNDKKHELDIMLLQIELAKFKIDSNLEEVRGIADFSEISTLYNTYKTGINWVDALNGTVRPVMAYGFFALYAFLKYIQYCLISDSVKSAGIYFDSLWTTDDQAIFAGIISFYFGQRTFSKLLRQK